MWKEIRGRGLAYSYSITLNPTQGLLILKLARAAQLTGAYEKALEILVSCQPIKLYNLMQKFVKEQSHFL